MLIQAHTYALHIEVTIPWNPGYLNCDHARGGTAFAYQLLI